MITLLLWLACSHTPSPDAAPTSAPVSDAASAPVPVASDAATAPLDAASAPSDATPTSAPSAASPVSVSARDLYGACRERVEGRETAGECATDADCSRAGCSQEVCVSAAAAGSVITTCERTPCLTVLDTCGCVEGVCSWSLKEPAVPLRMRPVAAPPAGSP